MSCYTFQVRCSRNDRRLLELVLGYRYHIALVSSSDRSGRYAALGVLLLRAAKNTSPQRTYFRLWSSIRTTSNWVVTLDLCWSKDSEPSVFCTKYATTRLFTIYLLHVKIWSNFGARFLPIGWVESKIGVQIRSLWEKLP